MQPQVVMKSMQAWHTADNLFVRQSEPKSCPEPICYIIEGRNPKFYCVDTPWGRRMYTISLSHCDIDLVFWH